jgi:hypothetical protein
MNPAETHLWLKTLSAWVGQPTALELIARFQLDTRHDLERLVALDLPVGASEARDRLHNLVGRCGLLGLTGLKAQLDLALAAVHRGDTAVYRLRAGNLNQQFQDWSPVLDAALRTLPRQD